MLLVFVLFMYFLLVLMLLLFMCVLLVCVCDVLCCFCLCYLCLVLFMFVLWLLSVHRQTLWNQRPPAIQRASVCPLHLHHRPHDLRCGPHWAGPAAAVQPLQPIRA